MRRKWLQNTGFLLFLVRKASVLNCLHFRAGGRQSCYLSHALFCVCGVVQDWGTGRDCPKECTLFTQAVARMCHACCPVTSSSQSAPGKRFHCKTEASRIATNLAFPLGRDGLKKMRNFLWIILSTRCLAHALSLSGVRVGWTDLTASVLLQIPHQQGLSCLVLGYALEVAWAAQLRLWQSLTPKSRKCAVVLFFSCFLMIF